METSKDRLRQRQPPEGPSGCVFNVGRVLTSRLAEKSGQTVTSAGPTNLAQHLQLRCLEKETAPCARTRRTTETSNETEMGFQFARLIRDTSTISSVECVDALLASLLLVSHCCSPSKMGEVFQRTSYLTRHGGASGLHCTVVGYVASFEENSCTMVSPHVCSSGTQSRLAQQDTN